MATVTEPMMHKAQQEANARLRMLIGSVQGGLTIYEGSRVVYVNNQLRQIFGYSKEELSRLSELDLAAPEERPRLEQEIQEAEAMGLPLDELEFWAVRKDGGRRYVRNRYATGTIGDGVRLRFVVTLDLTEQELAQQAVLQGEELLQQMIDTSQALTAASDPEAMLRAVAEPVMRAGPGAGAAAHVAVLTVLDADARGRPEWASVVASIGEAQVPVGTRFHLSNTSLTSVLLSTPEHPYLIADVQTAKQDLDAHTARMMEEIHARAAVALPMYAGGQWHGLAVIAWPQARVFRTDEELLYKLLAYELMARVQGQRQREEAEHRAMWSQTAAEVSRAASTVLDTEELLQQVVDLVRQRFDLYYAGLFLVDGGRAGDGGAGNWAVLQVGTGQPGQKMVEQGHKLEIGGESMIGQCVATMQPRIAMDVGEEAVRFANPLLPDTRTELALPLISHGKAIGALTIQSRRQAAFSSDDIAVLQTMADQLAIAIENANLLRDMQARAEREQRVRAIAERIHRGTSAEDIMRSALAALNQMLGASRSVIRLGTQAALKAELQKPSSALPVMTKAVLQVDTVTGTEPGATLAIPIQLRGEMIGVVGFSRAGSQPWREDEIAAAKTIMDEVAEALERQRLLDETQRRAWQLGTSSEIGRTISSTLDMQTLLRQIVDTIKARFGYYFVAIMLTEGDQVVFQDGSTVGDSEVRLEPRGIAMSLDASSGMIIEAARTGKPVLANDVSNDPRYYAIPEMPETRSELDVPIMVAGKVIGVLDVQSDVPSAYTEDDVALLQALANQAGIAIENARLFQETRAYAEEQTILRQISQAVSESLDMQDLLDTTLEVALTAIGFESGLVSLSDEDGRELYLAAQSGLPEPLARRLRQQGGLSGTLCDYVFQTGEPMAIADVREGAPVDVDGVIRVGLLTYVGIPLVHRDQQLGTFCFFDSNVRHLDSRDLLILEAICRQIGVGIANARLYQQTQKALAEAEAAHQIYLRRGWREHLRQRQVLSRSTLLYERPMSESEEEIVSRPDMWTPEMARAVAESGPAATKQTEHGDERAGIAVPIRLRGQTLGVIGVESEAGQRQWTEDEIALLAEVSEQLAQALESARLYADTERSAERERLIGEITAKIRASTDVRDILKTTAEELGHVLGTSRAVVQLAPARSGSGDRGQPAHDDRPDARGLQSAGEGQDQREA